MARHRKNLRRIGHAGMPRFLTFSTLNRQPTLLIEEIATLFVSTLDTIRARGLLAVQAWVLMPEHVHLLVTPLSDSPSMAQMLAMLKRPVAGLALELLRSAVDRSPATLVASDGTPRFWQPGGGYDRGIESEGELAEKVVYIHENPVRRGLVRCASDWRWSSAWWYEDRHECAITTVRPK